MNIKMILDRFSLKNKIFFSFLGFILLVSVVIALFTRYLLISSLTEALQKRGAGIAQSVAESARSHLLTRNSAELTALAFDAKSGNRIDIVAYLIIEDEYGKILAHTFLRPFPKASTVPYPWEAIPDFQESTPKTAEIKVNGRNVFHLIFPVNEGLYTIGFVHIGLAKEHIQHLIAKLRALFLSFLSAVTIVFFGMSHWLSRRITRPISSLIRYTDRVASQGDALPLPRDLKQMEKEKGSNDEISKLTRSFIKMITRIRSSREKIIESESKYRSLFNSGPNPIFVLNPRTLIILDANPKATEIFGYDRKELIGMDFGHLGALSYRPFRRTYPTERSVLISAKVSFYKKNGASIFVNIHAGQTLYRNTHALIVATTDITELVEKDSQLIQAAKISNIEKMSVGIAHELNQPLNAIKLGSEYLSFMSTKGRPVGKNEMLTVSQEISQQVTRAGQIIGRLKKFSRKSDFSREQIDLDNCIRAVNHIIGRQLLLQNIHLILSLNGNLPPIMAHQNRIEQVVFNLISNARDAIFEKLESTQEKMTGEIQIATTINEARQQVIMVVKDNGIGMDKMRCDKIFESFYTTKKMGEGMGLGLAIIKGIVQDFSGTIDVESAPGKGAAFTVTFPVDHACCQMI